MGSGPEPFKLVKAPVSLVLMLGAITALPPMAIDMYLPSLPAIAMATRAAARRGQADHRRLPGRHGHRRQLFYGPASDRFGHRPPLIFDVALFFAASLVCAWPASPAGADRRAVRPGPWRGGRAGGWAGGGARPIRPPQRRTGAVHPDAGLGTGPDHRPLDRQPFGHLRQLAHRRLWLITIFGGLIFVWILFGFEESRSAETAAHARTEHPFRAYLALLSSPSLVGYSLALAFNGAAVFAYISAAPGLLEGHYGFSPVLFGLVFSLNSLGMIAMGQINARLLRHYTPEQIIGYARPAALVMAALLAGSALTGIGGMWGVLVPLFFIIGSFGFFGVMRPAAGLNVDPRRAGSISALMGRFNSRSARRLGDRQRLSRHRARADGGDHPGVHHPLGAGPLRLGAAGKGASLGRPPKGGEGQCGPAG